LGFAAYLVKPVRQARLLDAIAEALCGVCRPRTTAAADLPRPQSQARLLLAEDNEVNRIVASEILRRGGFALDMVESGTAAVQALSSIQYDLVLMDCQMPGMDGFEASRLIRQREKELGASTGKARHVPIIALTANAMQGDREICLAAGMDDYLPKPIEPDQLLEMIDAHLSGRAARKDTHDPAAATRPMRQAPPQTPPAAEGDAPVLNMPDFLARCLGDAGVAANVLDVFVGQIAQELDNLAQTIGQGDMDQLMRLAHRIKGSASGISAERVRAAAFELEKTGRQKDLPAAVRQLAQLKSEVETCIKFIVESRQKTGDQAGEKPLRAGG
jgi:CheY-like chemotaxis protein/HPt (histidine-containing phosphotransfer) domain-containing protein